MSLTLVFGPGRAGCSLALAEARAGREVLLVGRRAGDWQQHAWDLGLRTAVGVDQAAAARAADGTPPELLILAVGDDALVAAAEGCAPLAAPGLLAAHLSGAHGVDALEPLARAGAAALALHPVLQFTEPEADGARLRGATFTLAGDADAQRRGAEVVRRWGGSAVELAPDVDRRRYHLGLALASNHVTATLSWAAELLAPAFGDDARAQAARMAIQAAEAFHARGGDAALTGPVVRGDVATVRAHFAALSAEEAVRYAGLLAAVLDLAERSGRLDPASADALRSLVAEHR